MKKLSILLIALFIFGCQSVQEQSVKRGSSDGQVVESTILWEVELEPRTWVPIELKALLENGEKFAKEGHFYKPKYEILVFGHKALYIGMVGIEFTPGPNATLEGSAESVKDAISKKYNISFSKKNQTFVADLKKDIKLLVVPHPNINGSAMVIGAYLGR